jgi:hypothetical protein
MGLTLDYARIARHAPLEQVLIHQASRFYGSDHDAPLTYEPSAHDFLSPAIAEADLMRRVLDADAFSRWLGLFLPQIPQDGSAGWLVPVRSPDPSDGKLSHLDGLNLSRAWMLEGIGVALPPSDPRRAALLACAAQHASAGLSAVSSAHYAGAHWLGSFAVYLLTRRGINRLN